MSPDAARHARALVTLHEGLRLKPYRDTVGVLTIGVGRNLDANGISHDEAEYLLSNDIHTAERELRRICPWAVQLDDVRLVALVDMSFNLGAARLSKFIATLGAVERSDYETASRQMLKSLWAQQVKGRAVRLSQMMASGEWPAEVEPH